MIFITPSTRLNVRSSEVCNIDSFQSQTEVPRVECAWDIARNKAFDPQRWPSQVIAHHRLKTFILGSLRPHSTSITICCLHFSTPKYSHQAPLVLALRNIAGWFTTIVEDFETRKTRTRYPLWIANSPGQCILAVGVHRWHKTWSPCPEWCDEAEYTKE